MPSDTSLTAFIASNPDARELKRALAVHMTQLGFKQRVIILSYMDYHCLFFLPVSSTLKNL